MRPLVAFALGLIAACGLRSTFACADDAACGEGGTCQPEGWCSFPDDTCPSGQRFGDHSGDGLGGACVDAEDTGGSEVADDGLDTGDATAEGGGSTSGALDTGGTMPLEDTGVVETSSGDGPIDTSGSETTGTPDEPTPIAWYSFDDVAAPYTDVSGNGHDAWCGEQVMECPLPAAGVVGLAIELDGISHHLHVDHGAWLETTTALSISVWVAPHMVGDLQQTIVAKALGPLEANSWDLAISDDVPRIEAGVESTDEVAFAFGDYPDDGTWHHAASVWDGNMLRLYVDGEEVGSTDAVAIEFDDHVVTIGCDANYEEDSGFFGGLMDELRIYDVALSAAEVAALAAR